MNKARRDKLQNSIRFLKTAKDIVEDVRDEESDCADNMPENLQESDRYSIMMDAIDYLDEACANIEEAIESVESAIE